MQNKNFSQKIAYNSRRESFKAEIILCQNKTFLFKMNIILF